MWNKLLTRKIELIQYNLSLPEYIYSSKLIELKIGKLKLYPNKTPTF